MAKHKKIANRRHLFTINYIIIICKEPSITARLYFLSDYDQLNQSSSSGPLKGLLVAIISISESLIISIVTSSYFFILKPPYFELS